MDSIDEQISRKQQQIKEAEMLEHAKKKARDIAKARVESGYANDKTQAISSSDYAEENTPAKHITEVEGADESTPKKKGGLQLGKKSVNSF